MAQHAPEDSDTASDGDRLPSEDVSGPLVVAIGASAGGLAALRTLFAHVPERSGCAWVVVVHLAPEHESHLADLLQPYVRMPVLQVTENMPVEADHVYVIPPNANLNSIDTHLRLSPLEEKRQNRAPIDHFFRTLAATHPSHAVGVILTGTGSDGSLGIREIKERNGLTVVQDPAEAEYDGMPQSAISTGVVDLVLPLEAIPAAVLRFDRTEPRVRVPDGDDDADGEERALLQKVLAQVRARTGRDFARYKRSTILRRIQRRMQMAEIEELPAYLERLRGDAAEVNALADDLLVNVSGFFRDPEAWDRLRDDVIPALFEDRDEGDTVRIWSVGCSTGEEAYSLAILLLEEAEKREAPPQIQIFASDLHEQSLQRAREGFYPGDVRTDVGADRLQRFFLQEDGGYRVRKEVREHVLFAPHNLLGDPPFSHIDLVACRNLLIYLQRDVQREVLELFHYALEPGGFLLLGTAEGIEQSDLFHTADDAHRLFRKRNLRSADARLPVFSAERRSPSATAARARSHERAAAPTGYGALHQRVVERFAPPSLLVGPEHRMVHLSEHAGRYLMHPGGEPTLSVFMLVREELRIELRTSLQIVERQGQPTRSHPIPVRINGEDARVVLDVRPAGDGEQEGFFLVIFDEQAPEAPRDGPDRPADGGRPALEEPQSVRLEELEAELDLSRRRLQSIIEEFESAQEELQSSNEELQSSNEELRSTMEELETSKEELQSMNEELQAVNQENRHRVEELSQLSGDLQNLLAATDIATLFLDRESRILRFTPKVSEIFNVRPVDRGRPLTDLTHRLGYHALPADAEDVLKTLIPVEREVADERGRWYLTRVIPYRSSIDRIEGVVITFVDITARKKAEEALEEAKHYAESIVETLHEPLLVLTPDLHVNFVNQAFFDHFDVERQGTMGHKIYELGNGQWDIRELRVLLEDVLPDSDVFNDYEVRHTFEDIGERVMLLNARRLDHLQLILLGIRDITEKKEAEAALRASEAKYRTLFNEMDEAYAVVEVIADAAGRWSDFRFLEVNPAFVRHTGMEDPVGRTATELLGTPNPRWAEVYGQVAETGQPMRLEDTEPVLARTFDLNLFRMGGPGSRRVAVLFSDITERKRAEAALRESEERLRLAVDATGLGISDWDLGTDRVMVNAGFREIFGVPGGDEVLGSTLLGEVVHPEDRARVGESIAGAMDPGGSGRFELEHRALTPAGQRWVLTSGQIYFTGEGSDRHAARMIGNHLDVTERRRADAERRAGAERQAFLLELSDALRAETEADAIATRALSVLAQRLRLDRCYVGVYRLAEDRGELSPQVGTERVPPVPAVVRLSDFPEALRVASDGTLVFEDVTAMEGVSDQDRRNLGALGIRGLVVATLRRGQGNPFWSIVAISADPRRWEPGEIALVEEVAERTWGAVARARAEAALRELNETLEQRVEERTGELEAEIRERKRSEELRRDVLQQLVTAEENERRRISQELHDQMGQQVTGLLLGLRALRDIGEEARAERLQDLEAMTDRIARDMQTMALELRPPALDTLGLVAAVQNHLDEWSVRHGIEHDFHASGLAGSRLEADVETTLYRIVQEGLTNVLKHAEATHVSVILELRDSMVRMILEDDGEGFDVDATLASPEKARRLGVRGMRERVALLGGELEIESSADGGATLFVRLPVAARSAGEGGNA